MESKAPHLVLALPRPSCRLPIGWKAPDCAHMAATTGWTHDCSKSQAGPVRCGHPCQRHLCRMAHPKLGLSWRAAVAANKRSAAQPTSPRQERRPASAKEGTPGTPQEPQQHPDPQQCTAHDAAVERDVVACAGCGRQDPPRSSPLGAPSGGDRLVPSPSLAHPELWLLRSELLEGGSRSASSRRRSVFYTTARGVRSHSRVVALTRPAEAAPSQAPAPQATASLGWRRHHASTQKAESTTCPSYSPSRLQHGLPAHCLPAA
jgi:hypothetical protein